MGIDGIGKAITGLPRQALRGVDALGKSTITGVKYAGRTIASHTPQVIKNNKERIAGFAVIAAAAASLTAIITGIKHKIKDTD